MKGLERKCVCNCSAKTKRDDKMVFAACIVLYMTIKCRIRLALIVNMLDHAIHSSQNVTISCFIGS